MGVNQESNAVERLVVNRPDIAGILGIVFSFTRSTVGLTKDAVTNLPWYWYRKQLSVEYWQANQPTLSVLWGTGDAELILRELKGALLSATPMADDSTFSPTIVVNVLRASDGALLMTMDGTSLETLSRCRTPYSSRFRRS